MEKLQDVPYFEHEINNKLFHTVFNLGFRMDCEAVDQQFDRIQQIMQMIWWQTCQQ